MNCKDVIWPDSSPSNFKAKLISVKEPRNWTKNYITTLRPLRFINRGRESDVACQINSSRDLKIEKILKITFVFLQSISVARIGCAEPKQWTSLRQKIHTSTSNTWHNHAVTLINQKDTDKVNTILLVYKWLIVFSFHHKIITHQNYRCLEFAEYHILRTFGFWRFKNWPYIFITNMILV